MLQHRSIRSGILVNAIIFYSARAGYFSACEMHPLAAVTRTQSLTVRLILGPVITPSALPNIMLRSDGASSLLMA